MGALGRYAFISEFGVLLSVSLLRTPCLLRRDSELHRRSWSSVRPQPYDAWAFGLLLQDSVHWFPEYQGLLWGYSLAAHAQRYGPSSVAMNFFKKFKDYVLGEVSSLLTHECKTFPHLTYLTDTMLHRISSRKKSPPLKQARHQHLRLELFAE